MYARTQSQHHLKHWSLSRKTWAYWCDPFD